VHDSVLKRRSIHGVLLLDKPVGFSSNAVLQKVKRIFRAKKAGHTGSLDPLASGMLPICFGQATKFSRFLLNSNKIYQVTALLGVRTTTGDQEGDVVDQRVVPAIGLKQVDRIFDKFRGDIEQVPSMYSALKHQGQPLYKLAREGITVERPPRRVTVYDLVVIRCENQVIEFRLNCSKGTYVRTLVDDFGKVLGCGAHVIALRRLSVGAYCTEAMVAMETLESARDHLTVLDQRVLPLATAVAELPEVRLNQNMAFYLQQGQSMMLSHINTLGFVRIATKAGQFLGVGEMIEGQRLIPRRLIQTNF